MTSTNDFTGTRTLDVAPAAIVEGSMFADRYAIETRIGVGAQSSVYAALDMMVSPPRRVALKIARPNTFDEASLKREADFLARFHQQGNIDGIVRLVEYDVQVFGGVKYLVLEYIDGVTLRDKTLPLAEVCRVGVVLARTLAKIHEANVVSGDVKPDNILLRQGLGAKDAEGDLKPQMFKSGIEPVLVDFGAAREIHDSKTPALLTPAYASPEQRAGGAPTYASDVYALAIVLEELAGPRPSKRFLSAMAQCKAVNPAERPTALEFSHALEKASHSHARSRFRWSILGLVGLLLGMVGTVVLMMLHHSGQTGAVREPPTKPALTMISAPGRPFYMTLGESHVYWSNADGRAVFRAPLGGGHAELVTQIEKPTHQIAVAGQTLFIRSPGEIWSFANSKLKRFAESTGRGGITADARNVAWTNEQTGDVVISSMHHDTPFRVLASEQAHPYSVTMDTTHVYWANEENGTLMRVLREGGLVEMLARGQSWPASTVVDETYLYWLDRKAGSLMRIPKAGGEPQIVTRVSVESFTMAVNKTHLYWTSTEDGRVMRILKTGGAAEVLARGLQHPFDLVVRGNELFFSNNDYNGNVIRLVLP